MTDIAKYIESLGGLHDAKMLGLTWQTENRHLEIAFDDIYWNFEGLPEYPGPTPAKFVFTGVSKFAMDADLTEDHMISDWVFHDSSMPALFSELIFWSGRKITVACDKIACVQR